MAQVYAEIQKFNHNHDKTGRFSTNANAAFMTIRTKDQSKQHLANAAINREKEKASTESAENTKQVDEYSGITRGHRSEDGKQMKWDDPRKTEIIADELKCSKKQAEKYVDAITDYYMDGYFDIRQYQSGNRDGASKAMKKSAEMVEEYIGKAPQWNGGTLYRGINVAKADMDSTIKNLQSGSFDMRGTSSWSSKKTVADEFAKQGKQSGKIIFVTDNPKSATSISHISVFGKGQSEVIVSKDTQFKVNGEITKKNGVYYVPISGG